MNSYQKEMQTYIENVMKKEAEQEAEKERAKNNPSFRKHLEDKGLLNSNKEPDDDVYGSFREYIDRKENKDNE